MGFKWDYALSTNVGGREINEDAVGAYQNAGNYCFVLCDGLGGHGMGEVASALVRDVFEDMFRKTDDMVNFLGDAFSAAQSILLSEQQRCHAEQKMKTTGTALVIDETHARLGHIGDSRIYWFNHGRIKARTLDHSVPQMLALSHEIKESEIRHHHDRSIVLRVLGTEWEQPQYELMAPIPLRKCDAFLLCTDGFWELLEEKNMIAALKKTSTAKEWLENMLSSVKINGAGIDMDNYSAIAVRKIKE